MHIIAIKSAWPDEAKKCAPFHNFVQHNLIQALPHFMKFGFAAFPKMQAIFSLVNAEVAGAGYSVGHTVTICTIWRHWRCTGRDGSS